MKKKLLLFYWTNDLSEKMNEIDGKLTIILKTNEMNFFWITWTNELNGLFKNDERTKWKKSAMPIFTWMKNGEWQI